MKPTRNKNVNITFSVEGIEDNIADEIFEVILGTKFNKLSYPLCMKRCDLDDTVDKDDKRVITVGYIKKYLEETNEFVVVLFEANRKTIEAIEEKVIIPVHTEYDGHLGTITRLCVTAA